MRRATLLLALAALAASGLRPAAALWRRRGRRRSRRRCVGVQVAPIAGRAGWLVRTALEDRLGATSGAAPLPARGRARRRDHRLRHPLRRCRDARAADAARPLPAGRCRDAARCCSTPPPARMPASTSSAPNMRRSPPSRPRSSGCRSRGRRPDRRAGRALRPRGRAAAAVRRGEGEPGAGRAGAQGAGRDPLLPAPRPGRIRQRARWRSCSARRWARMRSGSTSAAPSSRPIRPGSPTRRPPSRCSAAPATSSSSRPATRRCRRSRRCSRRRRPAIRSIVLAGGLKPTSKLLKLALAAPDALAFASYLPDGATRTASSPSWARAEGLIAAPRRRPADRRELRRQSRHDRAGAGEVRALSRRGAGGAAAARP